MAATILERENTHVPDADDRARAEQIFDFMTEEEPKKAMRYVLLGDESVELTEHIYLALMQVVAAMRQGQAVAIVPTSQSLTTQQAAELLGMSRPTFVKLLDGDELAFERVGSHRRVKLVDVLDYRRRRREARYAALEAIASDDLDDDEAVAAATSQRLQEIRARRGEARRSHHKA